MPHVVIDRLHMPIDFCCLSSSHSPRGRGAAGVPAFLPITIGQTSWCIARAQAVMKQDLATGKELAKDVVGEAVHVGLDKLGVPETATAASYQRACATVYTRAIAPSLTTCQK